MDREQARAFHNEVPVVDLHADTPKLMDRMRFDISLPHDRPLPGALNGLGHVDLPRMRAGGVAGQIFGLWTFPYPQRGCARSVHRQLDALDAAAAAHADEFVWAPTASSIREAKSLGKTAFIAGIEGAQALEGDLDNIAVFAKRGVRYIGLLHFSANQLGYPAYGHRSYSDRGLTALGKAAIEEMHRLGVIVDLAHINRKGFFDAVALADVPVMVTHTGVSGVHPHWRNIDDDQLRAVADTGGCVGVIFAKRFLGGRGVEAVCDHVLHMLKVAGEDLPALGSDFDGFVVPPQGLDDISMMPNLTAALSQRGVPERVLKKILGENALRVLSDVPPRVER